MTVLAVCCGLLSGIGGLCLVLTLHWVQHVAYGYSLDEIIGPESFFQGVSDATPWRRFFVLCACGLVAGIGWGGLARYGRHRLSARSATDQVQMPVAETVLHALLQVITVALGSPLGREVAPREMGALLAQRLLSSVKLSPEHYRLLLSCGAGAGLAAVYEVPVAGTVFIMEVMLGQARIAFLWAAAVSCLTSAFVARSGLGYELQYTMPAYSLTFALVVLSTVMGPVFGTLGFMFRRQMSKATVNASPDLLGIIRAVGAFAVIGLFAMKVPAVLGNGKGPAELAFTNDIAPAALIVLLFMKLTAIRISLHVGAKGGLLTPGLSVGALLGLLFGSFIAPWVPGIEPGAVAIIGATAFVSSSMRMPLTALCLVMEFTNLPFPLVLPLAIATAGSEITRRGLDRVANQRDVVA
ncbi:chloride channel protein [Agrobacterium tumefaciens]|uniref:chloride channel protein n=1 Tax=Agrobacterium tumefaciens TaxID=358 RepID=UPI00287EB29A|nr:chloride channel protein [Agrobacterium tumefaciens]MDS7593915.1 chloride channel protein [Agrobacterium tumefaciens]